MEPPKDFESPVTQERLREVAWEVGARFPVEATVDFLALTLVNARLGFMYWQLRQKSVDALQERYGDRFHGARLIIRVYDVTYLLFNGENAHWHFDIDVHGLQGKRYFSMNSLNRNYIAEIGFCLNDGYFHPLVRSRSCYFGNDRPSGNYQAQSAYVRWAPHNVIPVENFRDAVIYEQLHRALQTLNGDLSLSLIYGGGLPVPEDGPAMNEFLEQFSTEINNLGFSAHPFLYNRSMMGGVPRPWNMEDIQWFTRWAFERLIFEYRKKPFTLIHCHDWCSSAVGLWAMRLWNLPMVMSLHTTPEKNDEGQGPLDNFSQYIEKTAARMAKRIIVPEETMKEQVLRSHGIQEDRVIVIPTPTFERSTQKELTISQMKETLGIRPDAIIGLFAGEMSYAGGADLLMDTLPEVCRQEPRLHFIFIGEGPLRGTLQHRAHASGIGDQCSFWGDVDHQIFMRGFTVANFVAFPARQWKGDDFIRFAIEQGKPFLTTHQAGIPGAVHGQNGVVVFDHRGSVLWGLKEILSPSFEAVRSGFSGKHIPISTRHAAIQHVIHYGNVLNAWQEAKHV